MTAEKRNYDHLPIDLAIVADGKDTGRDMADTIIAQHSLRLVDGNAAREIIEEVTEDLEAHCSRALKKGVPAHHVLDWRSWYKIGYSGRIEEFFGKRFTALQAVA